MKAGIFLECSLFFVPFFSLNDLEGEIAAVRKELKEVEKVNGLFRNIINSYAKLTCFFFFNGTQELEFQQKKKERIQGDKFVESMGSFAKVSLFSMSELDDSWKEMKAKVKVTHTTVIH